MNRTRRVIIALIIVGLLGAAAVAAFIWLSGGSGQASQEIQSEAVTAAANSTVFAIVPDESEVRFVLDEDLFGNRNTVTGRTKEVAGEIAVDFTNPANTTLGTITINVRTLTTDNEFRNRAIRGQILQSQQSQFEFAEFKPTAIEGLPESVTMGEPFTLTITGDLTLKDITKPVTFTATITPVSDQRIEGSAEATVQRDDYGLTIPNAPGVANVDEAVKLQIDFVATPTTNSTT